MSNGLEDSLLNRINQSENINELTRIQQENQEYTNAVLARLLQIKNYEEFISMLDLNYENMKSKNTILINLLGCIKIKEIAETKNINGLLCILLKLVKEYGKTYEAFKICQVISDIVQSKKQFPSKEWMIDYFSFIAEILKQSGSYSLYLNALAVLSEQKQVIISQKELDFYNKVIEIKKEKVTKDLLCGIKPKQLNSISIDHIDSTFVYDPIWDEVFSLSVRNTKDRVAFLLKNRIPFTRDNDILTIDCAKQITFVAQIFDIANRYRPSKQEKTKPLIAEEEKTLQKQETKEVKNKSTVIREISTKKIAFVNRFTPLYKRFKLLCKYFKPAFEDRGYDERCKEREERFSNINKRIEEDKKKWSNHSDTIEELRNELKQKIKQKALNDYEKDKVQAKIEETRRTEERKANMWRSENKEQAIYKPSIFTSSSEQFNQKPVEIKKAVYGTNKTSSQDPGIYVCKFNTSSSLSKQTGSYISKSGEEKKDDENKEQKPASKMWRRDN